MDAPLVSVLVPFKNTEQFLPECLDSVLTQSYQNWELIAVDDDSEDTSLSILKEYANNDSRIQVLKNKGTGIIHALQMAYSKCSGHFITRMDSDDVMTPNRLEWMVRALHKTGKGHLAVGQVRYFSHRGISDGYAKYEAWLNRLTATATNYDEIYKECVIPSPCWMAYREDFEKCDGFNPNRYPEDYDLTFRFYENRLKIIPCPELLHLWRDYDHRTSRTSEHYAQNYFLEIKMHYFLKLDYDKKRPLAVWGAGFKGKTIAKKLVENEIPFTWLCDNPNKINKTIYGQSLHHFSLLPSLKNPQSLITVANEQSQREIKSYLERLHHKNRLDYFFFC
ncbi:glycosyltransferase family 2 protein [Flagellimonas allohymeniacidonis]|uniref:Glycosyltransferase n=1 Tax=Flagellimonas allohymeniacidonis TaxID=2517819 RepID=A0A4Q8QJM3_9FLAO|nr:glycosyltransferase [Allomuricauda hymeniacidonis]TAI48689.1 glycosyltransferase [Allomuricauda hymeniacidonis]